MSAPATRAMELALPEAAATDALGRALAATQPEAAVVWLRGDLGAGKSTLARAWLRALGVTGPVRSPTYTLVEPYVLADPRWPGGARALHLDLYRIADAGELEFLALDDAEAALWLVEWPERGAGALPAADLVVDLALDGPGRRAALTPGGPAGAAWLARLAGSRAGQGQLQPFPESGPEEVAPGSG